MRSIEIAKKIISSFEDRSGFDGWWGNLDSDMQEEILNDISLVIEKNTLIKRCECQDIDPVDVKICTNCDGYVE